MTLTIVVLYVVCFTHFDCILDNLVLILNPKNVFVLISDGVIYFYSQRAK